MKLSIIIPIYNEETTISEVVDRVVAVDLGEIEKEIIIANDGSTDASAFVIEGKRQEWPALIQTYSMPINLGKGAAVRLGLHHATGDLLLIQDADLELNPEEYLRLLQPILDGQTNVVYGSRFLQTQKDNIPRRTRMANKFLSLLTSVLFRVRLSDMETAYKVFRREAIADIKLRCVHFDFEPEITGRLCLKGERIVEVPISYSPRQADEGKKISWVDGVEAIYTLIQVRFF